MPFDALHELRARMRDTRISAKKARCNQWIRAAAVEIGELAPGVEYWICGSPMAAEVELMRAFESRGELPAGFLAGHPFITDMAGSYNGYVAFPKRHAPLEARANGEGILDYIPVHGGVTYAVKDQTACVYGFDTQHSDSGNVPRTDLQWIAWQCRVLYEGIILAARIERAYLRAQTNARRADILEPLVEMVPEQNLGIGALIRVMGGRL